MLPRRRCAVLSTVAPPTFRARHSQRVSKDSIQSSTCKLIENFDLSSWHIAGGEGQMANTTIKRVLKTNPDGSQEVVMVENDLDRNVRAKAGPSFGGLEV